MLVDLKTANRGDTVFFRCGGRATIVAIEPSDKSEGALHLLFEGSSLEVDYTPEGFRISAVTSKIERSCIFCIIDTVSSRQTRATAVSGEEPDVILQTDKPVTEEEKRQWWDECAKQSKKLGVTFTRFSTYEPDPRILLFEGWKVQPKEQGRVRFTVPAR